MNPWRLLRVLRQRLRALFRKEAMDSELASELAFHFERLVQENIDEGMSPADARAAASKVLGNVVVFEEECRDQRRVAWLHDLWQDLRYGARMLRRGPGFTTVAILSLALGIGANTAILGVVDSVFFGGVPLPNADRLVVVRTFQVDNPQ